MKRQTILAALTVLALAAQAAETKIDSPALVKPGDTTIDAVIAVEEAVRQAQKADPDGKVVVAPLPAEDRRSGAFNRDFQFLTDGKKVVWGGVPDPTINSKRESGSHLFRTEGPRDKPVHWWYERMKEKRDLIRASGGEIDIVMIGDSITHWWDRGDPLRVVVPDLQRTYSYLNLGYGGDHAETALWRARNGELDGYKAKVITIMIGTNNQGKEDTVESTAAAIKELVEVCHAKQPQAKILLHAIFPRCAPDLKHMRAKSAKVTDIIQTYADGKNVIWIDIRKLFLKPDDTGRFDLLGDGTHPGVSGVRVWRDALLPYFEKYTGKKHVAKDEKREPLKRRWFYCPADFEKAASVAKAEALVKKARGFHYTGVLLDAFDAPDTWSDDAKARFAAMRKLCADTGVELIPVVYPQEDAAFEAQAAKLQALLKPANWFITTNRVAYANTDLQREALIRQTKILKKVSPAAEQAALVTALNGRSGGLPRDLATVTAAGCGYFEGHDWPTMAFVPVDEKGREYWIFRAWGTQKNTPRTGVVYWTNGGDYDYLEDVSRCAEQRW